MFLLVWIVVFLDGCEVCAFFYECLFIFVWMYSERWLGRLCTPLAKIVSLGSVVLCLFRFETHI